MSVDLRGQIESVSEHSLSWVEVGGLCLELGEFGTGFFVVRGGRGDFEGESEKAAALRAADSRLSVHCQLPLFMHSKFVFHCMNADESGRSMQKGSIV